ncbi:MAG: response regulator [Desulfamplus sp.]|nr:response regulator [Desulfamplus sp.]
MIDINTMSVLIVDDMKSMRLSIRNMFKQLQLGNNIRHAENGREALKILDEVHVDMAVIDWNMPVMNGIELLNKIRSTRELRDMPVIMITAEAERDIVINVAESDIDAYLLKPLTMKSLEEKVKIVIYSANNPDKATVHLHKARDFEESGDINSAIEETRLALQERPRASRILRNLGLLYQKINNDKMTEKCLQKAVAVNKEDDVSRFLLVDFYLKNNDLLNALHFYEQARVLGSQIVSKGVEIGERLIDKGMSSQALEIFTRLMKKSKDTVSIRDSVINICMQSGEYEYVKQLLTNLIEEQPERVDLKLKAARLYTETNEPEKALEYYESVNISAKIDRDLTAEELIDVKLKLAKSYIEKKRPFIVEEYLNQILKIDPKHAAALELRRANL